MRHARGLVTALTTLLLVSLISREAVTVALGQKYNTKASRKWVEGFGEPARELTTLELVSR